MEAIAALGDLSVTLPAALFIAILLVSVDARRLALFWCCLFCAMSLSVIISKLALLGWDINVAGFTGISGHASRSAAVIPVLAATIAWNATAVRRTSVIAHAYLLAALISLSRLLLDASTVAEAATGFALGAGVSAIFLAGASHYRLCPPSRGIVAGGMLVLAICMYLGPAPTEKWMRDAAMHFSGQSLR